MQEGTANTNEYNNFSVDIYYVANYYCGRSET